MGKAARVKGPVVCCGWCGKTLARHHDGALELERGWHYLTEGAWAGIWYATRYVRERFQAAERARNDTTRLPIADLDDRPPRPHGEDYIHPHLDAMRPPLRLRCVRCGAVSALNEPLSTVVKVTTAARQKSG